MLTIYLGSILLEPARWSAAKNPTIRFSEWTARAKDAGFAGAELWENHYLRAIGGDAERRALRSSPVPLTIFNTYAAFTPEAKPALDAAAAAIKELGDQVTGVKFNVGKMTNPERLASELRTAREWAETLPPRVRLLCECHPGTALEKPDAAAKAFRGEWADTRRFAAIVHPFSTPPDTLRAWIDQLGPRIAHLHVQVRHPGNNRPARLDQYPRPVLDALRALKDGGVRNASYTLEFTEGTSTPDDVPDKLWENVRRDLAFLREHADS